jgi:hypothetical protein
MFSEAEQAAFIRATELLTEFAGAFPDWRHRLDARSDTCAWPPPNNVCLRIRGAAALLTGEVAEWFRERDWIACAFQGDVIVAPLVETTPPDRCFHTTPAFNEDGIQQGGLLRGADAGRSTTGRADAGQRIHITFDHEAAAKWAEEKLLGKHQTGQAWVMFEIDSRGIVGRVFRDPASETGYILEARAIAKEFLKVVRQWRPDDTSTTT